jgi:hypothetical protein
MAVAARSYPVITATREVAKTTYFHAEKSFTALPERAWGARGMPQPIRKELLPYATKLHDMQFVGEKPKPNEDDVWHLYGIRYIDDLRGQFDREQEEA